MNWSGSLKKFSRCSNNFPTFFEVVTVLALNFFAEQKCDLVIWETGLGGRLDATNIVTPLASVITNIAFDHEQWLGDTLEKIAAEKAGIIKSGIPVVTAEEKPEALAVIEKTAREKNAMLVKVTQASRLRAAAGTAALRLLGEHQKINAGLALATVEVLQKQISATEKHIREGLANVDWPGRLQLIRRGKQKILLDGAHNVAGAEALRAALEEEFAGRQPVLIFGVLADKNWPDICRILAPLSAKIFTVPVASERTADANELAKIFHAANPSAQVAACKNFSEAIIACKNEPFVVVTGSLYLVGEALEVLGFSPAGGGERGLNEWSAAR
jgi:dihydrofolate synthase / folylpolyglutamate synthase